MRHYREIKNTFQKYDSKNVRKFTLKSVLEFTFIGDHWHFFCLIRIIYSFLLAVWSSNGKYIWWCESDGHTLKTLYQANRIFVKIVKSISYLKHHFNRPLGRTYPWQWFCHKWNVLNMIVCIPFKNTFTWSINIKIVLPNRQIVVVL